MIQFNLTKDYLVITFEKHIIFAKISKISVANRKFRAKFKQTRDPKTRGNLIKEFIREEETCDVSFHILNFGTLSESIIAKGIKIAVVSEHNIQVAEKGEVRNNVI